MKTLIKLNQAIEIIKKQNLKKKGKNTFSKYDYYTPEQVSELVMAACHEVKLYPKFDLIRNELGIFGKLSIFDIESDESIIFEMASAIPEIKATNISQQLGGAMTYTKRYLLMNAFDIVDNNLDFDTIENTQKNQNSYVVPGEIVKEINDCETKQDLETLWKTYQKLHENKTFVKLVTKRKNEL